LLGLSAPPRRPFADRSICAAQRAGWRGGRIARRALAPGEPATPGVIAFSFAATMARQGELDQAIGSRWRWPAHRRWRCVLGPWRAGDGVDQPPCLGFIIGANADPSGPISRSWACGFPYQQPTPPERWHAHPPGPRLFVARPAWASLLAPHGELAEAIPALPLCARICAGQVLDSGRPAAAWRDASKV